MPSHVPFPMPAFVAKVSSLVHSEKPLSDSLSEGFLSFIVGPTPLIPIAALTSDSVILNQHACVCSVFQPTCGLPVPQIRKGWESGCFISCFEYSILSSQSINDFNIF